MTIGQTFEAKVKAELLSSLTTAKLKRAADLMGKAGVEIIKQRTREGIDFYGRGFGNYNQGYLPAKKKRFGRNPGWLQATGQLFEDITYVIDRVAVSAKGANIRLRFTVKRRSLDKAIGLMSETGTARNRRTYSKKAWRFLGLSQSGSRVLSEQKQLIEIFNKTALNNSKNRKSLDIKVN